MKKIILIPAALFFWMYLSAQKLKESEVPGAVKATFEKQFPNAKATWEKEKENYEATFKQGGKNMSSVINKDGTILETETSIAINDLPQSVQDYVKIHYKGARIKEAARITSSNGEITYEALVNGADRLFDSKGKFLRTAKE